MPRTSYFGKHLYNTDRHFMPQPLIGLRGVRPGFSYIKVHTSVKLPELARIAGQGCEASPDWAVPPWFIQPWQAGTPTRQLIATAPAGVCADSFLSEHARPSLILQNFWISFPSPWLRVACAVSRMKGASQLIAGVLAQPLCATSRMQPAGCSQPDQEQWSYN